MVSSSSFNLSTRNADDAINASSSSSSSSSSSPTPSVRSCCRMNHAETQDDCVDCMNDHTMMNTSTASTIHQRQKNQKRCRHLDAQKLNNSAAICIDIGLYDRAISSLSKALKLSEQQDEESEEQDDEEPAAEGQHQERNQENPNDDDDDDVIMDEEDEDNEVEEEDESMTMVCPCYHCTIDGCIEYSEMNKSYFTTENNTDNDESDDNDAFLCQAITDTDTDAGNDTNSSSSVSASYIYRRPIQVSPQAIQEEHNLGSTLCLMIAFNLALAYHLKAISMQKNNSSSSSSSTHSQYLKHITVALKLYTHVLQWQARLIHQQNDNAYYHEESSATIHSGMRFKMILLNNMSQLYRQNETSSSSSYQLCLQSLLSNIMLVVEYKTRIFNHNASLSSLQLPYIMNADLEQFIHNTSPLLMGNSSNGSVHQDHCASVA